MAHTYFPDTETLKPDRIDVILLQNISRHDEEGYYRLVINDRHGRLMDIDLIVKKNGQVIQRGLLGRERQSLRFYLDVKRTLSSFLNLPKSLDGSPDFIVGFNVYDFELLFPYQQTIINQVNPNIDIRFARYRSSLVFDAMREFERWYCCIPMDEPVRTPGLESLKDEERMGDGSLTYFTKNDHLRVAEYWIHNVEVVRQLSLPVATPRVSRRT
jgi:hypothetical protein